MTVLDDPARLNVVLAAIALIVLVAVLAVRLAASAGLPSLLLYLGLGLAIGEAGLGLEFDDVEVTQTLGLLALALILAEGGLTTRWTTIRPVLPFALVLSTVGVAVSVGVVAVGAHLLIGVDWRTALLLGAVVSSTDAAAVFSVLRNLPLRPRLVSALEAESGLNDAPVVILVALLVSDAWAQTNPWVSGAQILFQLFRNPTKVPRPTPNRSSNTHATRKYHGYVVRMAGGGIWKYGISRVGDGTRRAAVGKRTCERRTGKKCSSSVVVRRNSFYEARLWEAGKFAAYRRTTGKCPRGAPGCI